MLKDANNHTKRLIKKFDIYLDQEEEKSRKTYNSSGSTGN